MLCAHCFMQGVRRLSPDVPAAGAQIRYFSPVQLKPGVWKLTVLHGDSGTISSAIDEYNSRLSAWFVSSGFVILCLN